MEKISLATYWIALCWDTESCSYNGEAGVLPQVLPTQ
jgi:hypothetical protein